VKFRLSRVSALLFCSGACALIYQVAWFRELRLIFGASTAASAAVLAVFMGGLGIGGARLGKRADAASNPLALYAHLEIAVACMAAVTPFLVLGANAVYLAAGGSAVLGPTGATLSRVALSIVVLGPATVLMGGTLPAAARAASREDDRERRRIAVLYGVNTMGAVLGAVLANFLLLEVLGTRLTLWCAALVNLLVGVLARSLARGEAASAGATEPPRESEGAEEPSVAARLRWFPPAAAALAGGAFMLMELTWYRMLAPLLGGSSYTFGLILAVALAGIGIGGGLYARTRTPATLRGFAATCSLEALFIVIPYALGDRVALTVAVLRPFCRIGFLSSVVVWSAIAGFVVLPAAVVSGAQFPLVIGLYGRGSTGVGRDVGSAYFANTLGAIAGSLAGGFGLVPLLGAVGCWRLIVMALAIGAVAALLLDLRGPLPPRKGAAGLAALVRGLAPAALAVGLLATSGPSAVWRHSEIGAGRADKKLEPVDAASIDMFTHVFRRSVRWEEDGRESSVALSQRDGFNFIVNGKADGHAVLDGPTQVMSGLLPAMLHPSPKSALVVGLGTGSTAGWLGKVPSIDRVDVVELEPAIVRVARDCAPVNANVLDNPKVHIQLADARETLRTTPGRYDIIFSEPSNPYRAGISSMYTVEYYRAAAERLAAGGYFVQWIQAYEIDDWAISTVLSTLRQVFPDVSVWQTAPTDLLLLARQDHAPFDASLLRARVHEEPFVSAAGLVWRTDSLEGILSHFVAHDGLVGAVASERLGAVNTDDQNLLEFAFARSVGHRRRVDTDLTALARRLGQDRPNLSSPASVEWDRVLEERWFFQELEHTALDPPLASHPEVHLAAVLDLYRSGRCEEVLAAWAKLSREPRSRGEAVMLADCAARAGNAGEVARIEAIPYAVERDVLRALVATRHGELAGAAEALTRAFVAARTDPWVRPNVLQAGLDLAATLGASDPRFSRQLYIVLKEPFSVESLRDQRLITAARAAAATRDAALCVEALAPLEPPPLDEKILQTRAACYTKMGHPLATKAVEDLSAFAQHDRSFGSSIPTPAPKAP
jgi:spermidine synthase